MGDVRRVVLDMMSTHYKVADNRLEFAIFFQAWNKIFWLCGVRKRVGGIEWLVRELSVTAGTGL